MELRELKYFLAIANEESISKASQSLFVSQPNLSRQMQSLEKELGQQLFIRGTRKIVLTEAGRLLKKRAEDVVELIEKTKKEFISGDSEISGTVFIGGGESYAVKFIAQTAKRLQETHKNIKFSFFSGDTNDVVEKLDKGLLDFGILVEPAKIEKYDFIRLPFTDKWGVLMRKDSPLSTKDSVTKEDLVNKPLIFSKHSLNENIITDWLCSDRENLNIVATYNLIYNASLMVSEGMGYAIGLDNIINTSGDNNLCFRALIPAIETHLDIVWRKNTVFSKQAQLFLNYLQEDLKSKQDNKSNKIQI